MGSHSVICHPTQVNTPRLNLSYKLVLDLPTPDGWKAELPGNTLDTAVEHQIEVQEFGTLYPTVSCHDRL